MIIGIILFFCILYWDVTTDYKKWKNDIPVNHTKEGIIRSLLLSPVPLLLSLPFITIWELVITIPLVGFMWLLLFDGFYNKVRGFNWWFLGSEDKDDSWWDKFQRRIPLKILKITKIGIPLLLIICLCIYQNK